jgi:hypothetical protein
MRMRTHPLGLLEEKTPGILGRFAKHAKKQLSK